MYRLYTHNDLDGVSCGILGRLAFGREIDIRYNSVQGLDLQIARVLERDLSEDELWITDLSVNKENEARLDAFYQNQGKITLLDHHKTALHFNDYKWGQITVEYEDGRLAAATSLYYEHLLERGFIKRSDAVDEFVELVRQWDTWEWDKNQTMDAKRLNDLFFMLSIDEFEERMVKRLQENEHFAFDEFEQKLLEMEETKIERYIRRKRRELVQTFIGDYCVGIVHAESYHSELGNDLGKDSPHLDYIAILNVGSKKMSFRTIHDDIDVSDIAGYYGGGGHAKAAGSTLTEEAYDSFVAKPFTIEPLRLDAFRNHYNLKHSKNGSLYINHEDHHFFIYPVDEEEWVLEQNDEQIQTFGSFEEAERELKRNHLAWLARDERYVQFIAQNVIRRKQLNAYANSLTFIRDNTSDTEQTFPH
ncbi:DHH family phosphoesterase [Halalkalibacter urbisdiaboli]|uniref:DHH family phosphoesterase n=1 Tax=Halalkalibacter urbisdiaboli TaxID=1960589 RepID=UPI0013FD66AD|nr:DHHA1 domain-containing protein [Halalkalibacter urbisdiaboli]